MQEERLLPTPAPGNPVKDSAEMTSAASQGSCYPKCEPLHNSVSDRLYWDRLHFPTTVLFSFPFDQTWLYTIWGTVSRLGQWVTKWTYSLSSGYSFNGSQAYCLEARKSEFDSSLHKPTSKCHTALWRYSHWAQLWICDWQPLKNMEL